VQGAISENHQTIVELGEHLKNGHLAKLSEAELDERQRKFVEAVKKANKLQNESELILRDAGLNI
jgi:hypothetical protein